MGSQQTWKGKKTPNIPRSANNPLTVYKFRTLGVFSSLSFISDGWKGEDVQDLNNKESSGSLRIWMRHLAKIFSETLRKLSVDEGMIYAIH